MTKARWYSLGAAVMLALWIVLAFVAQIPNGWVHAPLAIGSVLVALAIGESG